MANKFFKWDKSQPNIEKGLGFGTPLEIFTAETAARYMNKYVPFRHGELSQTYETGADGESGYVKYNMPYAHRQYNGVDFNFNQEMHPLATDHWDRYMMLADGDMLRREIALARLRFIV